MIGLNYYSRTVKSVSSDHINYSMVETYDSWSIYDSLKCNCLILVDRAERHDLKLRFLLFILLFFFPLFLSGKTKREKSCLSVRSSCIILPPSVKIYIQWRAQDLFQQVQKINLGGAEKNEGGQNHARRARKFFLPTCFLFCPPGRNQFCPTPRQNSILPPRQKSILPPR